MSANIQSSPNMSSSYMYRNSQNKTIRPPTLPQYTTPTSTQTKGEMFFKSTETTAENSNLDKPPKHPTESTQEIVKKLNGYVGFANLPNQVYRKAVEKGFEFTLMVVGESGLGKSTLINSMFMSEIYGRPTQRLKKTVAVETTRVMLEENGVKLLLTMVDTPGFGDAVDNSNCWLPVIEYIESKYEDYLYSESRVVRKQITDQRVHCCLYFIQPSGHGLKRLDIEFMKHVCDKVNIIPVIAKADTLTSEECALFKKQILYEIAQNKIKIYEFPDTSNDGEEDKLNKSLKDRVPFAVVGSNTVVEIDGKKVRGRKYPWGIVQVDNLAHCDLMALRDMLIRTHLLDLKEITSNVHYENYRFRKLTSDVNGLPSLITKKNPIVQMEAEMEEVLEMKVRERKQKLKDSEAELTRRHEATKKQLKQQVNELKEKRRQFELEKENQMRIDRKSLEGKKEKKKKGLF